MMQGTFVHSLGRYLLVDMAGPKAKRIFFSHERPVETSELAEGIVAHLERGAPCPKAELDMSARSESQKQIYAVVQSILRGKTRTYGEVAALAGRRGRPGL